MLVRAALAIIVGYVIFAGSAVLLFHAADVDPHSPAPLGFSVLSIAYGLAFALLGGFVAGRLGRRPDLVCGIGLAAVIGLGALVSMIARPGAGSLWTQIAAFVVFTPASFLGDWMRKRQKHPA